MCDRSLKLYAVVSITNVTQLTRTYDGSEDGFVLSRSIFVILVHCSHNFRRLLTSSVHIAATIVDVTGESVATRAFGANSSKTIFAGADTHVDPGTSAHGINVTAAIVNMAWV
jgi:hypothetical protein